MDPSPTSQYPSTVLNPIDIPVNPSYIENMPVEILMRFFSYLNAANLINCNLVCRQWRNLTNDSTLWKGLWERRMKTPLPDRDVIKKQYLSEIGKQFIAFYTSHTSTIQGQILHIFPTRILNIFGGVHSFLTLPVLNSTLKKVRRCTLDALNLDLIPSPVMRAAGSRLLSFRYVNQISHPAKNVKIVDFLMGFKHKMFFSNDMILNPVCWSFHPGPFSQPGHILPNLKKAPINFQLDYLQRLVKRWPCGIINDQGIEEEPRMTNGKSTVFLD